jgi:hypothetical protein
MPLQDGQMDTTSPSSGMASTFPGDNQNQQSFPYDPTFDTATAVKPHDPLKTLSAHLQMGADDVAKDYKAMDMINDPTISDSQFQEHMQDHNVAQYVQMEKEDQSGPWWQRIINDSASSLPAIGDTVKQGLIGGGVAAGANLATGGLISQIASKNPIIAATLGTTSFGVGFTMGSANSVWHQSAGHMARVLAQAGVDRQTTRTLAYTFGSMNAGLQMVGFKAVQNFAGKTLGAFQTGAINTALQHQAVKKVTDNAMTRIGINYVKQVGEQSTTMAAQRFNEGLAKMTAALIEHQSPDKYEDLPTTVHSTAETFLQALGTSAVLGAGFGAAGAVAGSAKGALKVTPEMAKEITARTTGKTPAELLDQVRESLKKQNTEQGQVEINSKGQVTLKTGASMAQEENPLDTLFGKQESKPEAPKESPKSIASGAPGQYQMYRGGADAGQTNHMMEGTYLAERKEYADEYAPEGQESYPVILKTKKPLNLQNPEHAKELAQIWHEEHPGQVEESKIDIYAKDFQENSISFVAPEVVKRLRERGYDAIVSDKDLGAWDTSGPIAIALTPEVMEKGILENKPREPQLADEEGRPIIPKDHKQDLDAEATQARMDQISADLRVLDQEESRLHGEISRKEKIGQDTSKEIQKLQRIHHTSDNLQHEGRLLESGILTSADQGGASGKIRMSKLNKIFADLHKDSVTAEKRGVQNVASLQDKLEQTVKAVTKDPEIRAKARQYINGVVDQKGFQKAVKVIHDNVNRMEQAKLDAENLEQGKAVFNKVQKMLQGNAVKLAGGKPVSNLPAEHTEALQTLRGMLKDERKIDSAITDFQSNHNSDLSAGTLDNIPAGDLVKYNMATLARKVLHGSVQDKQQAAGELADLIANGKSQIEQKRLQAEVVKKQQVQQAQASLGMQVEKRQGERRTGEVSNWLKSQEGADILKNIIGAQQQAIENPAQLPEDVRASGKSTVNIKTPEDIKNKKENPDIQRGPSQTIEPNSGNMYLPNFAEGTSLEHVLGKTERRVQEDRRQEPVKVTKTAKTPGDNAKTARRTVRSVLKDWKSLTEFLTPDDQNHALTKMTEDPKIEAMHNSKIGRDVATGALYQAIDKSLQESGETPMSPADRTKYIASLDKNVYHVTSQNKGGSKRIDQITKGQMLDIWLKAHMPGEHNNLRANGYSFPGDAGVEEGKSTLDVIGNYLDSKDKAVAQGILNAYAAYHPRVSQYWQNKHGVAIGQVENYTPSPKKGEPVELDRPKFNTTLQAHTPSSAKVKTANARPIDIQNPLTAYNNYVADWEHQINFDGINTTHKNIFEDPSVQAHIEENYGKGTVDVIKNFRKQFLQNDPMPRDNTGLMGALRADMSMNILGFKWGNSMLTHLTSLTAMLSEHNPGDLANGTAGFLKDPINTAKTIWNAPLVENRRHEGPAADLQGALTQNGLFGHTLSKLTGLDLSAEDATTHQLFNRLAFAGISYGDSIKAVVGGGIIYHAELAKGASPKDALITVERRMEQTQQGTGPGSLPDLYTQHPMVHTMLGMFQNEHTQLTGALDTALNDWLHSDKTPGDWTKLGGKVVALSVVPGALAGLQRNAMNLLPSGEPDSKDKQKQAIYDTAAQTISQPFNGVPVLNQVLEHAWMYAANPLIGVDESKPASETQSSPMQKMLMENLPQAISAWNEYTKPDKNPYKIEFNGPAKAEKQQQKGEKAAYKIGQLVGSSLGVPSAFFSQPVDLETTLRKGDFIGAMGTIMGMGHGGIAHREQSKPQTFNIPNKMPEDKEGALGHAYHFAQGYLSGHKETSQDDPAQAFHEGYLFPGDQK